MTDSFSDIEIYLKNFHTRLPGCTSDVIFATLNENGKNSYQLLCDLVPKIEQPINVLDLACGDGFLLEILQSRRQLGLKLHGIDMTPAELHKAKARLNSSEVDLQISRVQNLPYQDGTMDFVFCHMAFMLMDSIEEVLIETRRVLKPGGSFAIIVPGRPNSDAVHLAFRALIREALHSEGLENILAQLGDPRTREESGLSQLLEKSQMVDIKISHQVTSAQQSVPTLVQNYLTYYGPDLLSKSRFEKLKTDLTEVFYRMEKETGSLTYLGNYFLVSARSK
jgi:ubiquinone/menaquinone biosynthesis C-methylase UbiE